MKIATFNINSINAHIDNLTSFLQHEQPDILLLQEIKSEFNTFPFFELQTLGYDAKIVGQKSYNGVAVISRHKIKITQESLPEFDRDNARYIEADIAINNQVYRVASIYLPNGNPPYNNPDDTSKFDYKLQWMQHFYNHAAFLLNLQQPVILGGDFNVIMEPQDVYDSEAFKNNALFRPEVRQRLRAFSLLGYFDSFRTLHPNDNGYTFWDYSGAALQNDLGMRIDYLFMNSYAFDKLINAEVNKTPRLQPKPSDHTVLQAILK